MSQRDVYAFDLERLGEPEDVWSRLFFAWLKSHSEQNLHAQDRLKALEAATIQLHKAVTRLAGSEDPELAAAMQSLKDAQASWANYMKRGLDNVEKMAVLGYKIAA
ncbi:MAG: hypothetical protein ACE5Q3_06280, partial [Alphaproteobacteria bacterium]